MRQKADVDCFSLTISKLSGPLSRFAKSKSNIFDIIYKQTL